MDTRSARYRVMGYSAGTMPADLQAACQDEGIDVRARILVVNDPRAGGSPLSHASRGETLASQPGTWQGGAMDNPPGSSPAAGGCLLAICIVVGAFIGVVYHQISAGIVIGIVVGAVIASGVWLRDRRRRGD
jgi:hypothetical protein